MQPRPLLPRWGNQRWGKGLRLRLTRPGEAPQVGVDLLLRRREGLLRRCHALEMPRQNGRDPLRNPRHTPRGLSPRPGVWTGAEYCGDPEGSEQARPSPRPPSIDAEG